MTDRTILLVDYENVGDAGLEKLPSHQRLLLFVGQGQRPKEDFVKKTMESGVHLEMIPVTGFSRNNLDFHLAFYLGRLVEEDAGSNLIIFSKDKGFASLTKHIAKLGFTCTSEKPPEKPGVSQKAKKPQGDLEKVVAHLARMAETARPQKRKGLLNTIGSILGPDRTAEAPAILHKLVSARNVVFDDAAPDKVKAYNL
jgi:PIN domain